MNLFTDFRDHELVCNFDDSMSVSSLGSICSFDEDGSDSDNDSISSREEDNDECPAHYQQRRRRSGRRRRTPSTLCSAPDLSHFNTAHRTAPRQTRREPARANEREFTRSFSDLHMDRPSKRSSKSKVRKVRSLSKETEGSPDDRWAPSSMSGRQLKLSSHLLSSDKHSEGKADDRWSPSPTSNDLAGSSSHATLDYTPRNPRASMPSLLPQHSRMSHENSAANAEWKSSRSAASVKSNLVFDLVRGNPRTRSNMLRSQIRAVGKQSAPDLLQRYANLPLSPRPKLSLKNLHPHSPIRGISRWNSASSFTRPASALSMASTANWSTQPKVPKRRRPRRKTPKTSETNPSVVTDSSDNSLERSEDRAPSLEGIRFPKIDLDAEALLEDYQDEMEDDVLLDMNGEYQDQEQDHQEGQTPEDLLEEASLQGDQPMNSFPMHYLMDLFETIPEDADEDEIPPPLPLVERASDCILRAPKRRKSDSSLAFCDESDAASTCHSVVRNEDDVTDTPHVHPSPFCPRKPTRRDSLLDHSVASSNSFGKPTRRGSLLDQSLASSSHSRGSQRSECACELQHNRYHPQRHMASPLTPRKLKRALSPEEADSLAVASPSATSTSGSALSIKPKRKSQVAINTYKCPAA